MILKWAKDLKRTFFEKDAQMANKHMKRCSTSLIIREMQNKITMRYHFIPIRKAFIKKKKKEKKCSGRCGKIETIVHCWLECKMVWLPWKTLWPFLKKLEIDYHMIQQFHFWVYTSNN